MPQQIDLEERQITYKGRPGKLRIWIDVVTRAEFVKDNPQSGELIAKSKESLGDLFRKPDFPDMTVPNIFTGETVRVSREKVLQLLRGFDVDDAVVSISVNFTPDPGHEAGLPEDAAIDFHEAGGSEAP